MSTRETAFAIRWLEFELIDENLHGTFAAVHTLLSDETLTAPDRDALLDKWLARQWRRLSHEYWQHSDKDKYEALLAAVRSAGIEVPEAVATWRGTGWAG